MYDSAMSENQSKQSGDGPITLLAVWRASVPVIAAGLSAHVAVVGLTQFVRKEPLLIALVATLVFAGVSFALGTRKDSAALTLARSPILLLLVAGFTLVAVGAGVWLVNSVIDSGVNFYCEPLVPWRIEIALFGSFFVGFVTFMAAPRRRARLLYPLTMVGLLWILPFYGFFSAPLFLGISLSNMCPDRSLITTLLAALGMIAGEQAGLRLAGWISSYYSIKGVR